MNVYDNSFNINEWSIIVGLCIGLGLMFMLPKRFPTRASFVFFMCGVYSGFFFDNSLTIRPFGFYQVDDTSAYEIMDYLLYFTYGPISYLFFYVLDYIGVKSKVIPLYVFIWAMVAFGLEWIGKLCGVFHYEHGYKIAYSFSIYLVTFGLWVVLYLYYQTLTPKCKL